MKRVIAFICVLMLLFTITGCNIKDKVCVTKLQTTNSSHKISFEINENMLSVSGMFPSDLHKYLLIVFNKDTDNGNKLPVFNGEFTAEFEIPDKRNHTIELYTSQEEYGTYNSYILDFIKIQKVDGNWQFVTSPIYDNNNEIFNTPKDFSNFLDATDKIQSNDMEIIRLAQSITNGITDDYEKVRAIHDWVATNIYYDYDALSSADYQNMDAKNVFLTRRGVCEGYANLFAALVRSQNIPCGVQSGYALGIDTSKEWDTASIKTTESNHAWNEVYVDDRWIIVDATWDSQNQYKSGQYIVGSFITDIYFDSTLDFFSLSHKSINDLR